ncbi:hypothetical protein [Brevundimonas aveniformis]|mgnify:CR=1 FL=1|uniref:hypothetical protein n=1 Tax=Brevundimonas aveniformis TaxID=370977 RepID=UPI0004040A04|nr:hypothetical protein [Brevundimonas aveniformis]
MDREARIAIMLVALIVGWVAALIVLTRWLVPMILSSRFNGALPVATVVGVVGVLGLAWLAFRIFRWARRAFGR